MRNILKAFVERNSGSLRMKSVFYNRYWPERVLDTLEKKYHLLPKDMLRLGYIRRKVTSGKCHQDTIFIFNKAKACERNISVWKDQAICNNTDLILFKGNVYKDGSMYFQKVSNYGSSERRL